MASIVVHSKSQWPRRPEHTAEQSQAALGPWHMPYLLPHLNGNSLNWDQVLICGGSFYRNVYVGADNDIHLFGKCFIPWRPNVKKRCH